MEDCSWPAISLPCDGGEGDSCPISCAPCTVAAGWAVQGQGQGGTEIPSAEGAALPAAVGALENCCIKWIADTGSAHHLTDKTALEGDLRSFIRRNPDQVRLATANGVIPAKAALDLWAPEMGARDQEKWWIAERKREARRWAAELLESSDVLRQPCTLPLLGEVPWKVRAPICAHFERAIIDLQHYKCILDLHSTQ